MPLSVDSISFAHSNIPETSKMTSRCLTVTVSSCRDSMLKSSPGEIICIPHIWILLFSFVRGAFRDPSAAPAFPKTLWLHFLMWDNKNTSGNFWTPRKK